MADLVNHPPHYSGVAGVPGECIDYAEELGYVLGNAFKYVYRAGKKNPEATLEDLQKARFYLTRSAESISPALHLSRAAIKRAARIRPVTARAGILRDIALGDISTALKQLSHWIDIEMETRA